MLNHLTPRSILQPFQMQRANVKRESMIINPSKFRLVTIIFYIFLNALAVLPKPSLLKPFKILRTNHELKHLAKQTESQKIWTTNLPLVLSSSSILSNDSKSMATKTSTKYFLSCKSLQQSNKTRKKKQKFKITLSILKQSEKRTNFWYLSSSMTKPQTIQLKNTSIKTHRPTNRVYRRYIQQISKFNIFKIFIFFHFSNRNRKN